MVDLLIFNFNYFKYLEENLGFIIGLGVYEKIIIYDDGSSIYEVQQLKGFDPHRVHIVERADVMMSLRITLESREASQGQLLGLKWYYHLHAQGYTKSKFLHLMDADDKIISSSDEVERSLASLNDRDIYFLHPVNRVHLRYYNFVVKRELPCRHMWATALPTSSIIINIDAYRPWIEKIVSLDNLFKDVWLDARLQIVANLRSLKTSRLPIVICRLIHESNDSNRATIERLLFKQLTHTLYAIKSSWPFGITIRRCLLIIQGIVFAPALLACLKLLIATQRLANSRIRMFTYSETDPH